MIYSVHFYYHKIGSRKAPSKFEGLVFAKDQDHAEEWLMAGSAMKYKVSSWFSEINGMLFNIKNKSFI